jgi:hypothetical protein
MVARSRCPTEPVPDGDYIMRVGPRQPPASTLRAAERRENGEGTSMAVYQKQSS